MNQFTCDQHEEDHARLKGEERSRQRTLWVVIITAATMIAEIVAGFLTSSMALLADGVHMGTHAVALFLTLLAYLIAERNRSNPDFPFGPGKIGVLGGYTNAILLAITAVFMVVESVNRFLHPVGIQFQDALVVAVAGLVVNIVCALILGGADHGHDHGHGHDHDHDHQHGPGHHDHGHGYDHDHGHHQVFGPGPDHPAAGRAHADHNLRSAYLHVVTDALTSVLAIGALVAGLVFGLNWPDAAVGILGAALILRWAWGLLVTTSGILVDHVPAEKTRQEIRAVVEGHGGRLTDLHVLESQGRGRMVVASLEGLEPGTDLVQLKSEIKESSGLVHLTLELKT